MSRHQIAFAKSRQRTHPIALKTPFVVKPILSLGDFKLTDCAISIKADNSVLATRATKDPKKDHEWLVTDGKLRNCGIFHTRMEVSPRTNIICIQDNERTLRCTHLDLQARKRPSIYKRDFPERIIFWQWSGSNVVVVTTKFVYSWSGKDEAPPLLYATPKDQMRIDSVHFFPGKNILILGAVRCEQKLIMVIDTLAKKSWHIDGEFATSSTMKLDGMLPHLLVCYNELEVQLWTIGRDSPSRTIPFRHGMEDHVYDDERKLFIITSAQVYFVDLDSGSILAVDSLPKLLTHVQSGADGIYGVCNGHVICIGIDFAALTVALSLASNTLIQLDSDPNKTFEVESASDQKDDSQDVNNLLVGSADDQRQEFTEKYKIMCSAVEAFQEMLKKYNPE